MLLRMVTAYLSMSIMSENLWPFRVGCNFGNNRIHNGEWIVHLRYPVLTINLPLASMSNPEALSWCKINASSQRSGLLRWNTSNSRKFANNLKQQCRVTVPLSYKELEKNNDSQSCVFFIQSQKSSPSKYIVFRKKPLIVYIIRPILVIIKQLPALQW